MTTTMAMVYENVENYGAKSLHDKEILIALTGIKEDIAKDMLNEFHEQYTKTLYNSNFNMFSNSII